jgi:hypothetical protein
MISKLLYNKHHYGYILGIMIVLWELHQSINIPLPNTTYRRVYIPMVITT